MNLDNIIRSNLYKLSSLKANDNLVINNNELVIDNENDFQEVKISELLYCIITTLFYSLYRVFQAKNFYSLAIILSVIVFHSFSTRHISINLLNIVFYFIIMKSLYSLKK